jgi:hypothetical protein
VPEALHDDDDTHHEHYYHDDAYAYAVSLGHFEPLRTSCACLSSHAGCLLFLPCPFRPSTCHTCRKLGAYLHLVTGGTYEDEGGEGGMEHAQDDQNNG